ncbi:hypothetical protein B0H13DRAFT_2453571 [Mycena leptocephala]|nr:hypothetical protein B0H13DRAFT_2453571 [Mycena leptocephala]
MSSKSIESKGYPPENAETPANAPSLLPATPSHTHSFLKRPVAGLWKHDLCRRLYQIASVRTVIKTRAEKCRAIVIDLAIGLAIPLPLRHCYNIFEDISCLGETYETPLPSSSPTSPSSSSAPSPPSTAVLRIKSFYHSRTQFRELLSASAHANLNLNRYVCLMALASTALLLITPRDLGPVPGIYWRADPYSAASVETLRWATVVCALLFIAYFRLRKLSKTTVGLSSRSPSVWDIRRRGRRRGSVRLGVFASSLLYLLLSFTNPPIPLRNIQIPPPHLPWLLARRLRHPPRLHPKRHNAEMRLVRLLSDLSASYGGISPLEYEDKEKASTLGDDDAHVLTLGDVSGILPDYSDYSSSSAPSSASVGYGERGWGRRRGGDRGIFPPPRERAYPQPAGTSAHAACVGAGRG